MPLPNPTITTVPTEGDAAFPSLSPIQVIDSVGPQAANRQPNDLRTRDATLRDRVNLLIANMNTIATGGAGGLDYYLPRDGSIAMSGALDMNTANKIINLADPTDPQDAATKNYVDSASQVVPRGKVLAQMLSNGGPNVGSAGTNSPVVDLLYPPAVAGRPPRLIEFKVMVNINEAGGNSEVYYWCRTVTWYDPGLDQYFMRSMRIRESIDPYSRDDGSESAESLTDVMLIDEMDISPGFQLDDTDPDAGVDNVDAAFGIILFSTEPPHYGVGRNASAFVGETYTQPVHINLEYNPTGEVQGTVRLRMDRHGTPHNDYAGNSENDWPRVHLQFGHMIW